MVVFEPVWVEKLPFECVSEPLMVTTVQKLVISETHATFRETIEPSAKAMNLPKALETFRNKVSTFPGRYRWFPEALTTFPRGFERFPQALTTFPGGFERFRGD
jgi:hypothetical protein